MPNYYNLLDIIDPKNEQAIRIRQNAKSWNISIEDLSEAKLAVYGGKLAREGFHPMHQSMYLDALEKALIKAKVRAAYALYGFGRELLLQLRECYPKRNRADFKGVNLEEMCYYYLSFYEQTAGTIDLQSTAQFQAWAELFKKSKELEWNPSALDLEVTISGNVVAEAKISDDAWTSIINQAKTIELRGAPNNFERLWPAIKARSLAHVEKSKELRDLFLYGTFMTTERVEELLHLYPGFTVHMSSDYLRLSRFHPIHRLNLDEPDRESDNSKKVEMLSGLSGPKAVSVRNQAFDPELFRECKEITEIDLCDVTVAEANQDKCFAFIFSPQVTDIQLGAINLDPKLFEERLLAKLANNELQAFTMSGHISLSATFYEKLRPIMTTNTTLRKLELNQKTPIPADIKRVIRHNGINYDASIAQPVPAAVKGSRLEVKGEAAAATSPWLKAPPSESARGQAFRDSPKRGTAAAAAPPAATGRPAAPSSLQAT